MPAIFIQIRELWQRLKPVQRATVVGGAVLTLGLIAAMVFLGAQPEYGVLFSDLKTSDAQTIVEKLKADNVPYQLSQGGTVISVPAPRIAELRLQMAGEGALTGGHVGFDIFDKSNFGATDFAQRVNYRRAIEGELARTLEGMDEVETARVHISPARESVFTERGERAKASIVMRVRQNRELSRERTEAVVNLVASAVEGLDPGDISVMDTRGRVLTAPSRGNGAWGGGAGAFSSHLEARQRLETDTAARIISLLEPITGPGRVRADVAADLDFSQVEQTEEKYDPNPAAIRMQQTMQELRNNGTARGGVVGARANDPAAAPPTALPAAPAAAPAAPAASPVAPGDQRTSSTTNYEIGKTVRRTVDGGGRLKRLSVSVVVDYQLVDGKSITRAPEELKKIQELVAAAAGIDAQRGDQIVVQTIPFDQPAGDTRPLSIFERYRDLTMAAVKYGALLAAVLVLALLIFRPLRAALQATVEPAPLLLSDGAAIPAAGQTVNAEIEQAALPSSDEAPGVEAAPREAVTIATPRTVAELEAEIALDLNIPVPEVKRARAIKKQLVDQGLSEPDTLAMTIRGWLQENR
ncbi:MAG: flagellar basal-body MS-ring/collar protein FliF [Blastocatellia bacterium]